MEKMNKNRVEQAHIYLPADNDGDGYGKKTDESSDIDSIDDNNTTDPVSDKSSETQNGEE